MAYYVCYVLLILLVTSFATTKTLSDSMSCPTSCLDMMCTKGLGCRKCKTGTSKFYAGTSIGFVCLDFCPIPYTKVGEYCVPTPSS